MHGTLTFALVAGVFATFNPCGFAMLPAYLSLVILDSSDAASKSQQLLKALKFASLMGAGILSVFSLFALILFPISTSIQNYLPYITILIGSALVILGTLTLKRGIILLPKVWNPNVSPTGNGKSYYLYGTTFALGSISCTIGPFLAVTSRSLDTSLLSSLLNYLFYGLGFTMTIALLALATVFSRDLLIRKIRNLTHLIEIASAIILLFVGIYLIYFGGMELALRFEIAAPEGPLQEAFKLQGKIVSAVSWILQQVGLG